MNNKILNSFQNQFVKNMYIVWLGRKLHKYKASNFKLKLFMDL